MNLETTPVKKKSEVVLTEDDFSMDEFDFKPITSGLGFHRSSPAEVKPVFTERINHPKVAPKAEMNVYQNDLSLFYGQSTTQPEIVSPVFEAPKEEKILRPATRTQRSMAYIIDLLFVSSVVALVLTAMARSISMDLMEVWQSYPHEITPLVLTLFAGFYLIYFAVFEKSSTSTLGKNLFGLRVVDIEDGAPGLLILVGRSFVTLMNFVSLGLFSYFDLQSKITQTKIVRDR